MSAWQKQRRRKPNLKKAYETILDAKVAERQAQKGREGAEYNVKYLDSYIDENYWSGKNLIPSIELYKTEKKGI